MRILDRGLLAVQKNERTLRGGEEDQDEEEPC